MTSHLLSGRLVVVAAAAARRLHRGARRAARQVAPVGAASNLSEFPREPAGGSSTGAENYHFGRPGRGGGVAGPSNYLAGADRYRYHGAPFEQVAAGPTTATTTRAALRSCRRTGGRALELRKPGGGSSQANRRQEEESPAGAHFRPHLLSRLRLRRHSSSVRRACLGRQRFGRRVAAKSTCCSSPMRAVERAGPQTDSFRIRWKRPGESVAAGGQGACADASNRCHSLNSCAAPSSCRPPRDLCGSANNCCQPACERQVADANPRKGTCVDDQQVCGYQLSWLDFSEGISRAAG